MGAALAPTLGAVVQQHGVLKAGLAAALHMADSLSCPAEYSQTWRVLLVTAEGSQLLQCLTSYSSLLCAALPSRYCCNEPSCCCFDKPSEVQLVGGKGRRCGGCGAARYCCSEDQKQHWKLHRPVCRALAAAQQSGPCSKA